MLQQCGLKGDDDRKSERYRRENVRLINLVHDLRDQLAAKDRTIEHQQKLIKQDAFMSPQVLKLI